MYTPFPCLMFANNLFLIKIEMKHILCMRNKIIFLSVECIKPRWTTSQHPEFVWSFVTLIAVCFGHGPAAPLYTESIAVIARTKARRKWIRFDPRLAASLVWSCWSPAGFSPENGSSFFSIKIRMDHGQLMNKKVLVEMNNVEIVAKVCTAQGECQTPFTREVCVQSGYGEFMSISETTQNSLSRKVKCWSSKFQVLKWTLIGQILGSPSKTWRLMEASPPLAGRQV